MGKRFERVILVAFAILAVGLGFWGYARAGSGYMAGHAWNPAVPFTFLEAIRCLISSMGLLRLYDLFQPVQDPWQLVVAQVLVPGIALVSAAQLFLTGVRKNLRTAMARRKTNHTVVCGIGDVGMQIVQNLRAAHHRVVAVDLLGDSPNAATCENSGVPVLQGDAKNPQVLLAAGIRRARQRERRYRAPDQGRLRSPGLSQAGKNPGAGPTAQRLDAQAADCQRQGVPRLCQCGSAPLQSLHRCGAHVDQASPPAA